jgi:hypothetical protein
LWSGEAGKGIIWGKDEGWGHFWVTKRLFGRTKKIIEQKSIRYEMINENKVKLA